LRDIVTIKVWLDSAAQDAERRGLSALRPLLESLAQATSALRTADWNADATGASHDHNADRDRLGQDYGGPPKLHAEAAGPRRTTASLKPLGGDAR
jgi:hypothetical protein